jgi:hypothetical protein
VSDFYDRQGSPIDLAEWAVLQEDQDYKRVAWDLVNARWYVSTVWLGVDHAWWGPPPLIFETMVFSQDGTANPHEEWETQRYPTEREAQRGHEDMVAMVQLLDGVADDNLDAVKAVLRRKRWRDSHGS